MSDLIRREDVIKLVNQFVFGLCKEQNDEVRRTFNKYVEKIPTTYSVDKVVKELEELRKKDVCDYLYCDVCAYTDKCSGVTDQSNNLKWDKAIEIVKNGCVNYDVC